MSAIHDRSGLTIQLCDLAPRSPTSLHDLRSCSTVQLSAPTMSTTAPAPSTTAPTRSTAPSRRQATARERYSIHHMRYNTGLSVEEIANSFGWSKDRIYYLLRAPISPRKRKGRPVLLNEAKREELRNVLDNEPGENLQALALALDHAYSSCTSIIRRSFPHHCRPCQAIWCWVQWEGNCDGFESTRVQPTCGPEEDSPHRGHEDKAIGMGNQTSRLVKGKVENGALD